ncbi:MAG: glycerophosphodiester phosphodiesterase, partial [Gemmatimonadaceae bacterium]
MDILLDPNAHPVIAHRGASLSAPENTMPAFEMAAKAGADALELDVNLSADGVPMVIHDTTLDRTTDLHGPVYSLTAAQLRGADAGARFTADGGASFPWRARGVRIPILGEVLDAFPDMPLAIEIKSARAQWDVARMLADRGALERCVVSAFETEAVAAFREGSFHTGASRRELLSLGIRSLLRLQRDRPRYAAILIPEWYRGFPLPLRLYIRAARRMGMPLHVWTVNDPGSGLRLWRAGAAGIVTD